MYVNGKRAGARGESVVDLSVALASAGSGADESSALGCSTVEAKVCTCESDSV